jgi:hypothetical protein
MVVFPYFLEKKLAKRPEIASISSKYISTSFTRKDTSVNGAAFGTLLLPFVLALTFITPADHVHQQGPKEGQERGRGQDPVPVPVPRPSKGGAVQRGRTRNRATEGGMQRSCGILVVWAGVGWAGSSGHTKARGA